MSHQVVDTPFGKFQIHPQDLIGRTTAAGNLWDGHCLIPVAQDYGELGTRGVTILDVGANIGTWTVWLAMKEAWRVVAIEAHREIYQMLLANLDLNKDVCRERVIPLWVAAWDKPCWMKQQRTDHLETDGNIGSHYVLEDPAGTVHGQPLDAYAFLFGERVSLIKLDIEGAELPALRGLATTIAKDHPTILYEWFPETLRYQPEGSPQGLLESWGYTVRPWPTLPNNFLATWGR
jgi:FkbM family methyltransferase